MAAEETGGAAGAAAGTGRLENFTLYAIRLRFYLIGSDNSRNQFRVLKIDRSVPSELNINEDPTTYSESECKDLLEHLNHENSSTGGLNKVTKCHGIIGFIKFLGPYYMLLITGRKKIGTICGHAIYAVSKSEMIALSDSAAHSYMPFSKDENRYLRRGVDERGRVANDVEMEQIVFDDNPEEIPREITSVVQNRGSIPLFWSQETRRLKFKPEVIMDNKDNNFKATRLHFDNLVNRYKKPIIILSLIKKHEKKPRESLLHEKFEDAINHINKDLPEADRLIYFHWDFKKHSRRKHTEVLTSLGEAVVASAMSLTGFFHCQATTTLRVQDTLNWPILLNDRSGNSDQTGADDQVTSGSGSWKDKEQNSDISRSECSSHITEQNGNCLSKPHRLQEGVLRTNCIDCLDRTNAAQILYGLAALGQQLHALGLINVPKVDREDRLADDLMKFYREMGNRLALQYVGSVAHDKAEPALLELDSDQHYNGRRHSEIWVDEHNRSFIKRSLSDNDIQCAISTDTSDSEVGSTKHVISELPLTIGLNGNDMSYSGSFMERSLSDGNIPPEIHTYAPACDVTASEHVISGLPSTMSLNGRDILYSSAWEHEMLGLPSTVSLNRRDTLYSSASEHVILGLPSIMSLNGGGITYCS